MRINDVCRRHTKPFYAGGSFGLFGYIFCDLLQHDYFSPYVCPTPDMSSILTFARRDRSAPAGKDALQKNVKLTASYVPLRDALEHRWKNLTRKQTKELNPAVVFSVLGAQPLLGSALLGSELTWWPDSAVGMAGQARRTAPARRHGRC